MKYIYIISFTILINILFSFSALGQNKLKQKSYSQSNFEKNKIFEEMYHLRWYKYSNWSPNARDTLAYFVDDRNYRGIVNYGVTFRRRDNKSFHFLESNSMYFLNVEIIKCNYNYKDSLINIEGFVSGGWWDELGRNKKIENDINIFLGEKTDTINAYYLGNACYDKIINKKTIESKLNGQEIDEYSILDTFPAFYFKKYYYYKTAPKGRRAFKISGKVTHKTLLAFGARGCYSEIFDLGSMIYYPEKNQRNVKRQESTYKTLMIDNNQVADIEKQKAQRKEITYYTYTQNAETFILTRQYGKAKEEYNLLAQKYPTLFARDIHNAIRCAVLSRDFKNAFWWGEKLALKGVELPYFNSKFFNGIRKNPEWKNFSIKYDSICKNAQSKWNLNLKNKLTTLLNEDQADYGLENRKSLKVLYETTERVTGKLIDLIKKEGYPSEERVGSLVVKDTILVSFPDYNILIRHAMQQKAKNLIVLNELLNKSSDVFEYDGKRSFNNDNEYGSCFRIYKGSLYSLKSCGRNELELKKIIFKFNNPNGFIMENGNFVVEAHDSKNPDEVDNYYKQKYNLIMKLTDDWEFYEK